MIWLLFLIITISINNEFLFGCSSSAFKSGYSVLKPKTDNRNYKNVNLRNGITALLIEDQFSESAGFTVGIKAGSFNDPIYALGLFHLIEHVLFLGTKKYPAPESYDEFMAQHGGKNNAYTAEERTIYFNEIVEEHLEEGLDHFSQFFIEPLFYESIVNQEIHIVNSEHLKNIPNDLDRLFYTLKSYMYRPMSQFTTGNIETLIDIPKALGISIPKQIKQIYKKYYCGKNMFIVISSKRSIIEQEKLVEKYFSGVLPDNNGECEFNSKKIKHGPPNKPIINERYLGKKIHIKSVSGHNLLWLIWSFPIDLISSAKQPLLYLSYVLNSKHKNSLFWMLQKNNYITNSNSFYENYSFGSIFIYQLELTSEGSKNEVEIIGLIYKFINKLKKSKELLEIYQGIKLLTEREFVTNTEMVEKSPMYTTSEICSRMIQYGIHAALSGDILIEDIDKNLISEILNTISPFNTLFLSSDEREFLGVEDKIFHVMHTIEEIPLKTLNDWKYAKYNEEQENEIKLPIPEKCSPINLRIIQEKEYLSYPQKLDSALANIWWHGPVKKSHKIGIKILLKFPRRYYKGIETQFWGEIITYILNTLIEEKMERYNECGISFYMEWDVEGIIINIDLFGYSNDIDTLLNELVAPEIANISNFDCDVLNEIIHELNNSKSGFKSGQDTTISKIMLIIKSLQTSGEYTEWEYRDFINKMFIEIKNNEHNLNDNKNFLVSFIYEYTHKIRNSNSNEHNICELFKNWSYKLLHRQSIIAYLQGNISKNKSSYLIEKFILNSKILPLNNKYSMKKKIHKLVKPIDITVINPVIEDINNSVLTFYQFGIPSFEEKLHLMALQPIVNGYIYDNLRTSKQLGYIVFANIVPISITWSLVVGVEGDNSNSVETIEMNIQNTLYEFSIQKLGNMGNKMFEDIKITLIQELKSIENSFNLSLSHYWDEIRYFGGFSEGFNLQKAIDYINDNMTIEHLYNTFRKLINSGERLRSPSTIKAAYYPKTSKYFKQEFIDRYMVDALSMARRSLKKDDFY
ncbi:secreted insulinase-like peptidase [Cryptosporidium ubiquitum]|uniref:Secreted insulinase-like peptidase n=1 Tax=Cryptosporidium ubiquitum TaxID=857276 RepID=A0A1J4MK46_9CRYT|nr:secreted insulinase-like peptidase [Cryptosporidium ubiquitum]OII74609.1 secreted insulinase-like peptidase [Cryptosporidium ubiquitum]